LDACGNEQQPKDCNHPDLTALTKSRSTSSGPIPHGVHMAIGTEEEYYACPGRICPHLRLTMLPAFAITAPCVLQDQCQTSPDSFILTLAL
jgi:hypothetical protein